MPRHCLIAANLAPTSHGSIIDASPKRDRMNDFYSKAAASGKSGTVRPDFMNLLRIIRDQGLDGLKAAVNDPKELLPVLAMLGLGPALGLTGQSEDRPLEAASGL